MRFRVVLKLFLVSALFAPMSAWANALCVSAGRANLRAGPGTNHKISWIVSKYMPLKEVESKGSWIKVEDLDGETHWISSRLVSRKLQCVVVKTKTANLRTKPSRRSPRAQIPVADRYTPFKKLAREGSWLQIEDDYKLRFWVSDTNVWWPVKRSSIRF